MILRLMIVMIMVMTILVSTSAFPTFVLITVWITV